MLTSFLLGLAAAASAAPPAAAPALHVPHALERAALSDLAGRGADVDEGYRARFDRCDATDRADRASFGGWRGCSDDPNRVTALKRLPGGPILFVSKLAVDLDGSPLACGEDRGRSDQCPTTLMPPDASGSPAPVDADRVAYVVIPTSGPDTPRGEFTRLTGVGVGDFGVVIWRGRTVPVIVADTGPWPKLGEGSLALHRALGHDQCADRDAQGVCRGGSDDMASIEGGVTTVLFPGSAVSGLTLEALPEAVEREGARLWAAYRAGAPEVARGGEAAGR